MDRSKNPTLILPSGTALRTYPFVAWEKLAASITWNQGQHALTVGATGSGKSTVAGEFLHRRKRTVVCVSKGMDDIFAGPYYRDFEITHTWPPKRDWTRSPKDEKNRPRKILLWPTNQGTTLKNRVHKKQVFTHMFDRVLLYEGNWCICIDEEHYMSDTLKLEAEITDLLEQGRSAGISMWNNTQRPAGVPLATYVNSTMAFFFTSQEEYDVRRLARMRNKHTHPKEMAHNIEQLDSYNTHEHVFMDRTGRIPPVRSIVDVRKR